MTEPLFSRVNDCAMGLEPVGMPKVDQCLKTLPTPCARPAINAGVSRHHAESGIMHAASHFELLNKYIHKPIVVELFKCFRLHGFNVVYGDLGPEYYNGRGHVHSADITVEA